jgi:HEPN domain-containing protein
MDNILSSPLVKNSVDFILAECHPEKIYLLGYGKCETVNVLKRVDLPIHFQNLQLLILLSNDDIGKEDALRLKLNKAFDNGFRLTCIIVNIQVFNQWLEKGHLFAYSVYTNAFMIFDSKNAIIVVPGDFDELALYGKKDQEVCGYLLRADSMKQGADFFFSQGNYRIGAFMLQQAVELTLVGLIRHSIGYRLSSHNIGLLVNYAQAFCALPANFLAQVPDTHLQIVKWLTKSYIASRYTTNFVVPKDVYLLLNAGVNNLFRLTKELRQSIITAQKMPPHAKALLVTQF